MMVHSSTEVATVSITPRFKDGIRLVFKRYVAEDHDPEGVTLLFFHCIGSHKEVFEPVIPNLLSLKGRNEGRSIVREVWSFDNPSHGEASIYNDEALSQYETGFTIEEWADSLKALYASGVFEGHTLVPVGHSLGASLIILATIPGQLPAIPFKTIILVEDAMITREVMKEHAAETYMALETIQKLIMVRRDTWDSRQDARRFFEARYPWSMWDPRILDVYVAHALKEITVEDKGMCSTKVTLCCNKMQECTNFLINEPHYVAADHMRTLDPSVRIHFVHGEREDAVPEYSHQSILDLRPVASLQKVPDAGHLVVHENPDGVSVAIGRILTGEAGPRASL